MGKGKQIIEKESIWITGGSGCGKTTRLQKIVSEWVKKTKHISYLNSTTLGVSNSELRTPNSELRTTPNILILSANEHNRRKLADQLSLTIQRNYPIIVKTPLGFINEEIKLFYPLISPELNLKPHFPLKLRPETEQELATKLWRKDLKNEDLLIFGGEYFFVRRILDLLQLAGAAGIAPEKIPQILKDGLSSFLVIEEDTDEFWQRIGKRLLNWREWCLERGLLTYSLIYELYWRYLLPNPTYQQHLTRRYQAVFADDVDDYPAVSGDLLNFLLNQNVFGAFTYNPYGKVRLGLNADPNYLQKLASHCHVETLKTPDINNIGSQIADEIIELINNPFNVETLPDCIRSISTNSRGKLLRNTAEFIINNIKKGEIKPEEIAIIAPGLDAIGRYTLIEIFTNEGIKVEPLNEQRPLISYPIIRALLTLFCLVYEGLGKLAFQNAIAEMLVVLSQNQSLTIKNENDNNFQKVKIKVDIDPVRAGLIADYCYQMDVKSPCLLPIETFKEWNRLGYKAVNSYNNIRQWITEIKAKYSAEKTLNPIVFLDLAIETFFTKNIDLDYEKLANLRELIETAQHFFEVENRLKEIDNKTKSYTEMIADFIELLRRGTITANPYSKDLLKDKKEGAITLANIYQYRSFRNNHRWQFWLDISSNLWEKSTSSELFAAPSFLREFVGKSWTMEDQMIADKEKLERILRDLLARTTERVYLCHSELGINGTEQNGILLNLFHLSLKEALNY